MEALQYKIFKALIFDGQQFSINEDRLRKALRSRVESLIEDRHKFSSTTVPAKTNEFIRWVEQESRVTVNDNGIFLEDGEDVPNVSGPAVFTKNKKKTLRGRFIVATWWYFHRDLLPWKIPVLRLACS